MWYRQNFGQSQWYDVTGLPVAPDSPYALLRTKQAPNMVGFEVIAKFAGQADASTLIPQQAVFFHETENYASGIEFGFVLSPSTDGNAIERKLIVYWGKFQNCGATTLDTTCLSARFPAGSPIAYDGSDNVLGDLNGVFSLSAIFTPSNPSTDTSYRYRIYAISNSTLRLRVYPYAVGNPCVPDTSGCQPVLERDILTSLALNRIFNNGFGLPGFVTAANLASTNAPNSLYSPTLTIYGISRVVLGTTSSAAPTLESFGPRVITASAPGNVMLPVMQLIARDRDGYQNLNILNLLINKAVDGLNACYTAHSVPAKVAYLVPDAGPDAGLIGPASFSGFDYGQGSGCQSLPTQSGETAGCSTATGSSSATNSRCILHIRSTSAAYAASSGDGRLTPVSTYNHNGDLFLSSMQITAKIAASANDSGFKGNQIIWAAARDINLNNSGWSPMGVLRVPPLGYPRVAALSPAESSSSSLSFTTTFSDTTSASNISGVQILINNSLTAGNACYITYVVSSNLLYLVANDGANLILPGRNPGSSFTSVSNNQCAVTSASASSAGQSISLSLTIQGSSSFIGNRVVWAAAPTTTGAVTNSGWEPMGFWLVL